jgi:hypothetical protein
MKRRNTAGSPLKITTAAVANRPSYSARIVVIGHEQALVAA